MSVRLATIMMSAALGLVVSLYLLSVHWGWWQIVCLDIGDCEVVNTSIYAELLGIPVALLGAVTYVALLATGVLIWRHIFEEAAHVIQFLLAAVGVAFSVYLTYVEIFVLRAICPWCVLSAILITLIAGLSLQQWHTLETDWAGKTST
jgi:uncharacterized membrane protein